MTAVSMTRLEMSVAMLWMMAARYRSVPPRGHEDMSHRDSSGDPGPRALVICRPTRTGAWCHGAERLIYRIARRRATVWRVRCTAHRPLPKHRDRRRRWGTGHRLTLAGAASAGTSSSPARRGAGVNSGRAPPSPPRSASHPRMAPDPRCRRPTGASRLRCRGRRRQAALGRTTASASANVSTAAEAEALTLRPVAAICWGGFSQSIGWNVSPSAARTASPASPMCRHIAPAARIRLQIGHCIRESTSFQKIDGLAPEQGPYQFPYRRSDCGPNRHLSQALAVMGNGRRRRRSARGIADS
jgi:hypothetical protein